jgi:hypothetical protein
MFRCRIMWPLLVKLTAKDAASAEKFPTLMGV